MANDSNIEQFIQRWTGADGTERANYQLFLTQLCDLLELPQPEPASADNADNAYVFERRVVIHAPDGSTANGFIDLYKRGAFVCEAKQSGITLDTDSWDRAMMRAHSQADRYVRALPADETRPPFILVVDVGRNIDVYAEFTRTGGTYTPFPDPQSHRIRLEDLRDLKIQARLRNIWLDPLQLDPSKHAAKVTRDIADKLARLAKSLEARGHSAALVGSFLMRALFTMFAEDVGLLPNDAFLTLLEELRDEPQKFAPMVEHLWQTMNTGGFSPFLREHVMRFNGGLFATVDAIPLEKHEYQLLIEAARADWRYVEPAIFGTLLERALDPQERHKLGAHYTPRAYVERLVMPTIIEPLRYDWENTKAAALAFDDSGNRKKAVQTILDFQRKLAETRVLDPACGSGNFLYVTLEHMKRLEGEVLALLHQLNESQTFLEMQGLTVDPHQFLGMEINPRAAKIAEMVLWIGYLQWHFRTQGSVLPPEPVLRDFRNIENRDALIDYDEKILKTDESGKPITRWDGVTYKKSPITGEEIPDESAQKEEYIYVNPRKATWPDADFIIGNPPFIGASTMRRALGDGYTDAVRETWKDVPTSADFVMYWWHHAAELVRAKQIERFGFITTNSIKQTFNRRVLETHMNAKNPLTLAFAIPDHPWVDSSDGAAVRIAMTVGCYKQNLIGVLSNVYHELRSSQDVRNVKLYEKKGVVTSDLKVGADITNIQKLKSNDNIVSRGLELGGKGFVLENEQYYQFREYYGGTLKLIVRRVVNGQELVANSLGRLVVDTYGVNVEQLRAQYPLVYQYLYNTTRLERENNRSRILRDKWWLLRGNRSELRAALHGQLTYIATAYVAKHRVFVAQVMDRYPDDGIVAVAISDTNVFSVLGILSSRLHIAWALAAGGRLGVGNDPRYNKTRCFETFPFPELTPDQEEEIGELAERIDKHRKNQQALHDKLTLTNMYNVLEKLRSGEELTAKEREVHTQGLVSILQELHDALDRAVFEAYGWGDLGEILVGRPGATTPLLDKPEEQAEAEEELLKRLVDLNAERAREEEKGVIRWLRPEYQNPGGRGQTPTQEGLLDDEDVEIVSVPAKDKVDWPSTIPEQIAAVRDVSAGQDVGTDVLMERFKGRNTQKKRRDIEVAVESLRAMGIL